MERKRRKICLSIRMGQAHNLESSVLHCLLWEVINRTFFISQKCFILFTFVATPWALNLISSLGQRDGSLAKNIITWMIGWKLAKLTASRYLFLCIAYSLKDSKYTFVLKVQSKCMLQLNKLGRYHLFIFPKYVTQCLHILCIFWHLFYYKQQSSSPDRCYTILNVSLSQHMKWDIDFTIGKISKASYCFRIFHKRICIFLYEILLKASHRNWLHYTSKNCPLSFWEWFS